MEMQFKNEIKKLADIVAWADNQIEELRMDFSSLTEEKFKNLDAVKDLEAVKKVVLESMERHSVYTSALNKDLADKSAKIELLEKEIEGRKEGYVALKELIDTKYISIEEHNNICKDHEDTIKDYEEEIKSLNDEVERRRNAYRKDSEFIVNIKKELEDWKEWERTKSNMLRDANDKIAELEKELAYCNVKIRHQKENLDGTIKTLEIRTKENESLVKVRNNLNKEIEAHESENARLTEKIMKLHNTITELSHDIDNYKSWNADLHRDIKELKKKKEDDYGKSGFKRYIEHLIEEEERAVPERFKERLNQEITEIFTKKEDTEVEVDKSKNYGPIPESVRSARRAAKVNDIPCGEDSIE